MIAKTTVLDLSGMSRKGTLNNLTYQDLEQMFGTPNRQPTLDGKIAGGWNLAANNGLVSIYAYKDINWHEATEWSVGARTQEAANEVMACVQDHIDPPELKASVTIELTRAEAHSAAVLLRNWCQQVEQVTEDGHELSPHSAYHYKLREIVTEKLDADL